MERGPRKIGTKKDLDKPEIQAILAIDKSGWVDYKSLRARQITRNTTRVRTSCGLVTSSLELAPINIEECRQRRMAFQCNSALPSSTRLAVISPMAISVRVRASSVCRYRVLGASSLSSPRPHGTSSCGL